MFHVLHVCLFFLSVHQYFATWAIGTSSAAYCWLRQVHVRATKAHNLCAHCFTSFFSMVSNSKIVIRNSSFITQYHRVNLLDRCFSKHWRVSSLLNATLNTRNYINNYFSVSVTLFWANIDGLKEALRTHSVRVQMNWNSQKLDILGKIRNIASASSLFEYSRGSMGWSHFMRCKYFACTCRSANSTPLGLD